MKRTVWIAAALAATAAVVSGETGPTITVTGCLQNFSAKGTVGTTEKGFLLTNATTGDDAESGATDGAASAPRPTGAGASGGTGASTGTGASSGTTGTSGTAGTQTAAGAGAGAGTDGAGATHAAPSRVDTSYLLDGSEEELKDHVGRKVEVTGRLAERQEETPRTEEQHLQVESIRRLSSNCSQRPK